MDLLNTLRFVHKMSVQFKKFVSSSAELVRKMRTVL